MISQRSIRNLCYFNPLALVYCNGSSLFVLFTWPEAGQKTHIIKTKLKLVIPVVLIIIWTNQSLREKNKKQQQLGWQVIDSSVLLPTCLKNISLCAVKFPPSLLFSSPPLKLSSTITKRIQKSVEIRPLTPSYTVDEWMTWHDTHALFFSLQFNTKYETVFFQIYMTLNKMNNQVYLAV